jgi:hypothetical protein
MSRQAVYQAIVNDSILNDLRISQSNVFSNYTKDTTPVRGDPFVILRWEERPMRGNMQGPQILTVWAHWPKEDSTDYSLLDAILQGIINVLKPMEHVDGEDGNIVTSIRFTGWGRDLFDPGFDTITKNIAFEVQFRAGP